MKQRIKNKLDSWYNKFLSQAGKEVLLKAVVTALPTYAMSCFLLPKGLLKEITSYMTNFWWASVKDKHKIPWIGWNKITKSKRDGGLGMRNMESFNIALLAKQGWRLMKYPQSLLARVFKAKYYRHSSFLQAESYTTSSYGWRSIIQAQKLLKTGSKWIVGNGKDIRVWEDNGIKTKPSSPASGPGSISHPDLRVNDLLLGSEHEWNIQLVTDLLNQADANYALSIRPSKTGNPDTLVWSYTKDGNYSVKTGYHLQCQMEDQDSQIDQVPIPEEVRKCCSNIWKLKIPPRLKTFWWRVAHNSLAVMDNMRKRGIVIDNTCQTCGESTETLNHMLFECRVAKEIWEMIPTSFYVSASTSDNLIENINYLLVGAKQDKREALNFFAGWNIWKMRNNILFHHKRDHILRVIHAAIRENQCWNKAIDIESSQKQSTGAQRNQMENIHEILPPLTNLYCLVDASWKSNQELAGIGWSLHSKEGIQKIRGSSSIVPTNTSIEAEAMAMLMAVQQIKSLRYENVAFISDCKQLIDELNQFYAEETIISKRVTEAVSMIRDMYNISRACNFTFHFMSRSFLNVVDALAKEARTKNQSYVISWFA